MSQNILKPISFIAIIITTACFLTFDSLAQNYQINVQPATFLTGETSHSGYNTSFTQPFKMVKKEWWRYIKKQAIIFNYKTHYELTIPARKNEIEIRLVSCIVNDDINHSTTLQVALLEDNLSDNDITTYNKKIATLLTDFKVDFYTRILQEKIDQREKSITRIGKALTKVAAENTTEREILQARLVSENKELEILKNQLTLIK